MITYTFIFITEDNEEVKKDIYADFERQAWDKADDIAYKNGYIDYRLEE